MLVETDLEQVFTNLRKLLLAYSPPLVAKIDRPNRYELWTNKEVIVSGKKRKELYFAGIIVQSNYVGFYYMPIYFDEKDSKRNLSESLLELLKGKSCFHLQYWNKELEGQIKNELQKGFNLYKKKQWIESQAPLFK